MQQIGFIRGPFVIEGIIIGLIAALLTILMLGLAYDFIIGKIAQSDVLQRMNIGLLSFGQLSQVIAIVFLTIFITSLLILLRPQYVLSYQTKS